MYITVSLMSKHEGEIKRFLDSYDEKEANIDDDVIEWIYVYRKTEKALDIIDVAMDNFEQYDMSVWMQIEDNDIMEITSKNREKVTSQILSLKNS